MGEAQAALDLTVAYLKTRKAFGAPLWDKQAIRQRIASRAAEVEAGRQLVYSAAWRDARGHDVTREVSMVKAYCGELVNAVMYDCLQFHGGMGFMRESAIERMARMPVCRRSGAAPRKSCLKKSPSGSEDPNHGCRDHAGDIAGRQVSHRRRAHLSHRRAGPGSPADDPAAASIAQPD